MPETIQQLLPLLIPLLILQLVLAIAAIIHMTRNKRFKIGNIYIWIFVVLLLNMIGPILYFMIGKADEE